MALKESEMKKELEKEFPKDEMMQQLHLIRWKNYLKTKSYKGGCHGIFK